MLARIASTLSLWIITILVLYYFDSYGWAAIIALLSSAALYETVQLLRKMGLYIVIFLCYTFIDRDCARFDWPLDLFYAKSHFAT